MRAPPSLALIATCSGVYGGSLPAGIKAAQRLAPGQPVGFEFIVSFGIGAAVVTLVAWLLHWALLEQLWPAACEPVIAGSLYLLGQLWPTLEPPAQG